MNLSGNLLTVSHTHVSKTNFSFQRTISYTDQMFHVLNQHLQYYDDEAHRMTMMKRIVECMKTYKPLYDCTYLSFAKCLNIKSCGSRLKKKPTEHIVEDKLRHALIVPISMGFLTFSMSFILLSL